MKKVPVRMSCARDLKLKAKKTSTPERELNETLQCDLSVITPLDLSISSNNVRTTMGAGLVPLRTLNTQGSTLARSSSLNSLPTQSEFKPKQASRKEDTEEDLTEEDFATAVSNAHLKSRLMEHLVVKCTEQMQKDLDEDLYRLQKEIEKEQVREKELKFRLKTIKINREIERYLDAHEETIEKIVENLEAGNVAENIKSKCDAISKKLEKNENRIICRNIIIPESDESNEKLQLMIGETKKAFEELTSELAKQQIGDDVVEALSKTLQLTEESAQRQKRCEKGLEKLKTLTSKENNLRIMIAIEEEWNKNYSK